MFVAIEDLLPYSGPIYNCVIIDGANMIHKTLSVFSAERLSSVVKKIEHLGWSVHIGMKKGTFGYATGEDSNLTAESRNFLHRLHELGCITLIDAPPNDKEKDDHEIINTAISLNGWIVSNDKFRLHLKKLRELKNPNLAVDIESRLVKVDFKWGDDKPIINLPKNIKDESITTFINSQNHTAGFGESTIRVKIIIDSSEEIIEIPVAEPIGRDFLLKYNIVKNNTTDSANISRTHFRINIVNDDIFVTDLDSTNGTSLNGMKIPPSTPIKWNKGATLKVGRYSINFSK
jgi:hypothetical protein